MQLFRIPTISSQSARLQAGLALTETLVALALVSAIGVAFLSGLATTSKATMVADEQTTAASLAQIQMEWVKKATYVPGATTYSAAPIPSSSDYTGIILAIPPILRPRPYTLRTMVFRR